MVQWHEEKKIHCYSLDSRPSMTDVWHTDCFSFCKVISAVKQIQNTGSRKRITWANVNKISKRIDHCHSFSWMQHCPTEIMALNGSKGNAQIKKTHTVVTVAELEQSVSGDTGNHNLGEQQLAGRRPEWKGVILHATFKVEWIKYGLAMDTERSYQYFNTFTSNFILSLPDCRRHSNTYS